MKEKALELQIYINQKNKRVLIMKMENISNDYKITVRKAGRKSEYPPAKIADDIRALTVGQSFETGIEWRKRIYLAAWKYRPLAVRIEIIGGDKIRVWRTA